MSNLLQLFKRIRSHPYINSLLVNDEAASGITRSQGDAVPHLAVGGAPRVKTLLEIEVPTSDIDVQDKQQGCPQHHVAGAEDHAAMEDLLANGANVDLRDPFRVSVLHNAINTLTWV